MLLLVHSFKSSSIDYFYRSFVMNRIQNGNNQLNELDRYLDFFLFLISGWWLNLRDPVSNQTYMCIYVYVYSFKRMREYEWFFVFEKNCDIHIFRYAVGKINGTEEWTEPRLYTNFRGKRSSSGERIKIYLQKPGTKKNKNMKNRSSTKFLIYF